MQQSSRCHLKNSCAQMEHLQVIKHNFLELQLSQHVFKVLAKNLSVPEPLPSHSDFSIPFLHLQLKMETSTSVLKASLDMKSEMLISNFELLQSD